MIPIEPVALTADINDRNNILVNWSMSPSADYYDIYRLVGAVYTKINANPVVALSYLDETLSFETEYSYKVKAVNLDGESGFSNIITAITWKEKPLTETIWNLIKNTVRNDSALTDIKTFYFRKTQATFNTNEFPMVHLWPISSSENWLSMPKRKTVEMIIGASAKIYFNDKDAIVDKVFEYEAALKNAIDKDLQLSGKAIVINFEQTEYDYLDENILDARFSVKITSQQIITGGR